MSFARALFVVSLAANVAACSARGAGQVRAPEPPRAAPAAPPEVLLSVGDLATALPCLQKYFESIKPDPDAPSSSVVRETRDARRSTGEGHGLGTLTGKVVDSKTKEALADAVITATSPALQGEQNVLTDGSGFYRIPNLPPGDYALLLQSDGHKEYKRSGITIRENFTVRLDAELAPMLVPPNPCASTSRPSRRAWAPTTAHPLTEGGGAQSGRAHGPAGGALKSRTAFMRKT